MTVGAATQAMESAERLLKEYGFETAHESQVFPLIAANSETVVLFRVVEGSLKEAAERINGTLSRIFFERQLGPLSRSIYVILLAQNRNTESERILCENDSRICRKVVIALEGDWPQEIRRRLLFLKPISISVQRLDIGSAVNRYYLEAFQEKTTNLKTEVALVLRKACEENWPAPRILEAVKEVEGRDGND